MFGSSRLCIWAHCWYHCLFDKRFEYFFRELNFLNENGDNDCYGNGGLTLIELSNLQFRKFWSEVRFSGT